MTIIAAAIRFPARPPAQDFICHVPPPGRHHSVLHSLYHQFPDVELPNWRRTDESYHGEVQGFLTGKGEFLGRREALIHARECGQPMLRKMGVGYQGDELFSEDLW